MPVNKLDHSLIEPIPQEYHIVGEVHQRSVRPSLSVSFAYADLKVTVAEEELIYSFVSFVSEFGGSLGLFLGFSFYMALEPVLLCIGIISKRFFTRKTKF